MSPLLLLGGHVCVFAQGRGNPQVCLRARALRTGQPCKVYPSPSTVHMTSLEFAFWWVLELGAHIKDRVHAHASTACQVLRDPSCATIGRSGPKMQLVPQQNMHPLPLQPRRKHQHGARRRNRQATQCAGGAVYPTSGTPGCGLAHDIKRGSRQPPHQDSPSSRILRRCGLRIATAARSALGKPP
jgi:hypothetical protein